LRDILPGGLAWAYLLLTDFLHSSNDGRTGFAPIWTVNCTHAHTSQGNIVLFPVMSSGENHESSPAVAPAWRALGQAGFEKWREGKNKACPQTGFKRPAIAVCQPIL